MATAVSLTSSPTAFLPAIPSEPIYRLTVEQYHHMAQTGILNEDDAVELLEGWLIHKTTKKPAHWIAVNLIRQAFERLGLTGFFVHSQDPITTSDSEPEPDLAIIRGEVRQFKDGHPLPQDVSVVVEVADTTLQRDRGMKKRLYARAGIPVYWIVNLIDRQIEVYSQPSGPVATPDYGNCQVHDEAGEVILLIDAREVAKLAVKGLLP